MILVDTSVWIDHFKRSNKKFSELLENEQVVCHPFVIGELACGNLKKREEILELLEALPKSMLAKQDEVLELIKSGKLYGKGIGWIDAHLITSAILENILIWTRDKRLKSICESLKISYQ